MLQYYNIKYALIISLVIHSFSAVSQDRDLIWPLGDKAGIDFAGDSAVPIMNLKQLNLYITNVSISDNKGNLLFYSNGIEVANSLHDVMSNGDSLSPGKYTSVYSWSGMPTCQGAMIIPKPGDSLKYYIFHLNLDSNVGGHIIPDRLFYSVVDMSLDGGLGDLTAQKNVVVLQELLVEGRIAAVKHGNGRDWWLFVHKYETDRFSRFLITPSGIKGPYSQWIGYSMDYKDDWCGQTVFSPNGDMMANILRTGKIDVFDFDRCTGDLSNWRVLSDTSYNQVLGCSFSPNGQLLYVSTQTKLFQFEVNVSNIDSTRVLIDTWDGSYSPSFPFATYFGLHQLGPDGKIYVSTWN
ncbi:MAG: hypothetical protein IIA45_14375, partial [Bacteroidetes bacterium]|nr:hypothetical protein [Bacteroidota bacterium]